MRARRADARAPPSGSARANLVPSQPASSRRRHVGALADGREARDAAAHPSATGRARERSLSRSACAGIAVAGAASPRRRAGRRPRGARRVAVLVRARRSGLASAAVTDVRASPLPTPRHVGALTDGNEARDASLRPLAEPQQPPAIRLGAPSPRTSRSRRSALDRLRLRPGALSPLGSRHSSRISLDAAAAVAQDAADACPAARRATLDRLPSCAQLLAEPQQPPAIFGAPSPRLSRSHRSALGRLRLRPGALPPLGSRRSSRNHQPQRCSAAAAAAAAAAPTRRRAPYAPPCRRRRRRRCRTRSLRNRTSPGPPCCAHLRSASRQVLRHPDKCVEGARRPGIGNSASGIRATGAALAIEFSVSPSSSSRAMLGRGDPSRRRCSHRTWLCDEFSKRPIASRGLPPRNCARTAPPALAIAPRAVPARVEPTQAGPARQTPPSADGSLRPFSASHSRPGWVSATDGRNATPTPSDGQPCSGPLAGPRGHGVMVRVVCARECDLCARVRVCARLCVFPDTGQPPC